MFTEELNTVQEQEQELAVETMATCQPTRPTLSEVIDSLSKTQIASVKRVHQSIKPLIKLVDKLQDQKNQIDKKLEEAYGAFKAWETPVVEMLKGYSVIEVVNYLQANKTKSEEETI